MEVEGDGKRREGDEGVCVCVWGGGGGGGGGEEGKRFVKNERE